MATLAELESAYATLATIFRTDINTAVNAIKRQVEAGAGFDQVAGEISRIRAEFDNAYARVFEIFQQAQQLDPQPTEFLARLDRSLNTNQSNNRATLSSLEIQARENQSQQDAAVAETAADDQGSGAQSAGEEVAAAAQARDESSTTQNPPVSAEQQNADGSISDQAATTTPSNAESSQPPDVPVVPPAPGGIDGQPAPSGNAAVTSNGLSNTPAAGVGTLQQSSVSDAQQFYVYKAVKVTSNFSGGKFTQDLEGVLLQIPAITARNVNGVLTPSVPTNTAPEIERTTATGNTRSSSTAAPDSAPATVLPDEGNNTGVTSTTQPDSTTFSAAQNAPPDSDGQAVATQTASTSPGEGSATTNVGGFSIKASSATASNGVFVTVFVVSRGSVQGFASDINGIVAAAQQVQSASLGGVVEDVTQWVAGGGAAQLQRQSEAQAQPNTASTNQPINLARET